MLTANLNNIRVYAEECHDRKADYRCPECGEKVILAKGSVKISHFKHEAHAACEYAGETADHLRAKAWLYRNLKRRPDIEIVEAECSRFEGIRPDVAFKCQGKWFGVEIQHSGISKEEIAERTARYQKLGVYILWIATEKTYKKIFQIRHDKYPEIKLSLQNRCFIELHKALIVFTGNRLLAFTFNPAIREREIWDDGPTDEFYTVELKTTFVPRYMCRVYIDDLVEIIRKTRITSPEFTTLDFSHWRGHITHILVVCPRDGWDDFEYFDEFYGDSA